MNGIEATAAIKDRSLDIIMIDLSENAQESNRVGVEGRRGQVVLAKEAAVNQQFGFVKSGSCCALRADHQ